MRLPEIWDDWAVYDDDGFFCGIRDDAPEDVKEAYMRHLEREKSRPTDQYLPKF